MSLWGPIASHQNSSSGRAFVIKYPQEARQLVPGKEESGLHRGHTGWGGRVRWVEHLRAEHPGSPDVSPVCHLLASGKSGCMGL